MPEMLSERIARWSTYLVWLLLPFFFIPVSFVSVQAAKVLLVACGAALGVVALAIWSIYRGSLVLPKHPLLIATLLVPTAYLISAFVTGGTFGSLIGEMPGQDTVVTAVLFYTLFLLSSVVLFSRARLSIALSAMLLGGMILAVVQVIRIALPSVSFGGVLTNATSTIIGSWHDLAIIFGLFAFLSLTLAVGHREIVRLPQWMILSFAATSIFFLVIINQADVWFVFAASTFTYALYLFWVKSNWTHIALFAIFTLGSLFMWWGGGYVHDRLPAPVQITQVEVRPSWEGTFAIGQRVFSEGGGLLFGSGPNSFSRVWGSYKPLSVNATQFWSIDFFSGVGFIPTSVVTTGILGFFAWMTVVGVLAWSLALFFWRAPHDGLLAPRAQILVGSLYLAALHILYTPGFSISALTFLFFGALVAAEVQDGVFGSWTISFSWNTAKSAFCAAAVAVAATLIGLCSFQSVRLLVSDSLINRASLLYAKSGDARAASGSVNAALAILPHNSRANRAAVEIGLLELQRLSRSADASVGAQNALRDALSKTVDRGLAAVSADSSNYLNWLALARLYGELSGAGVEGANAQARAAYEKARASNRTNPIPLIGLAQLDLAAGDTRSAREHLVAASALKPNLAITHYLLLQTNLLDGKIAEAQSEAMAVVQLAPQDPLGWYTLGALLYSTRAYADATKALGRAIELQRDYADAYFVLGLSYYELGKIDEAIASFEKVTQLDSQNSLPVRAIENIRAGREPLSSQAAAEAMRR